MNVNWRGALIYSLILIASIAMLYGFLRTDDPLEEISLSKLVADINEGAVQSVVVKEEGLEIAYNNGREVTSRKEFGVDLTETLTGLGADPTKLEQVDIQVQPISPWTSWPSL